MSKRPETIETVLFTIELLRHIPTHRKVTAEELRAQLASAGSNVKPRDLRTVQRQLAVLCEHFGIECDTRSKPFGYRWRDGAKGLALPVLSAQESLLLRLAEEYLRSILPANLMKSLDGIFKQARKNLDVVSNTAKLERQWISKVRVVRETQPLIPPKVDPKIFETVSEALYENHWLQLDYKNAAGKRSEIEVMPLGLVQQGPRLYLVGRYRGYNNERNLALHRILSAKKSIVAFSRPKEFDLGKYDDDGRFGFGEGRRVRLSFRIQKAAGYHLLESPLSEDQQVQEVGDYYKISATVVDSEQLNWWLRGFGDQISHIRRSPLRSASVPTKKS